MTEFGSDPGNYLPGPAVTTEEMCQQLEKLLRSGTLSSSSILRKLLKYIGIKTIEGNASEIKEYVIGREVLGRKADFDPRIDTAVRVDAHRLREKLEEYYQTEGAQDEILLEIPKGHYVPCFSRRPHAKSCSSDRSQSGAAVHDDQESKFEGTVRQPDEASHLPRGGGNPSHSLRWKPLVAYAVALLCVSGGLLLLKTTVADTWENRPTPSATASARAEGETELSTFWAHFVKAQSQPIVTYSNAIFLATRTSDLLRLKAESLEELGTSATPEMARRLVANPSLLSRAGPVSFEDVYTGTGEVMAVFYLTHMFDNLHRSVEVERSRLVSLDDLRTHDVIFLGSTKEDTLLAGLPVAFDFVFKWPGKPTGVWDGKIVDLHPRPGERSTYGVTRNPKTGALLADYALISVLPGIVSGREVIVLGGLTTLGTQGAAEFATSPAGVADIFAGMGVRDPVTPEKLPAFYQAVLKISIMKGEVLNTKCVDVHVIHEVQDSSDQG